MEKIKQIRKKIIYSYKPKNRINNILNNYCYKKIVFLKLLQKHYHKVEKFNVIDTLIKQNFLYYFNLLKEFHSHTPFYKEQMEKTLSFIYNYIVENKRTIDLDILYFLSFLEIVENIPIKKVISEWDYKSLIDLQSNYLFIDNINDMKNLLQFKYTLPISKKIPIFEYNSIDIKLDNIIIEITTLNRINYIPSVNKLLKFKNQDDNLGIVINPRFELFQEIDLNN